MLQQIIDAIQGSLAKIASISAVGAGAVLGWWQGEGTDLGTDLGNSLSGAITGGAVVLIAAMVVRQVNRIADRREASAGITVEEYRRMQEESQEALAAERTENAQLRAALQACREHH